MSGAGIAPLVFLKFEFYAFSMVSIFFESSLASCESSL